MTFNRNYIWAICCVLIGLGLYPLQRYILKKSSVKHEQLAQVTVGSLQYLINQPDHSFTLPTRLDEISGLSLSDNDSTILAIQDEDGIVYFIHKETGEIVREESFGDTGDYEGVELVDGKIFISNNKGDIFHLPLDSLGAQNALRHKTFLNSDDNVEGLGYLPSKHALLVACKGARKKQKEFRKIFLYDVDQLSLDTAAYIQLSTAEIAEQMGRKKKSNRFSPSAIASHPQTNNLYIISSPALAMLVLNTQGEVLYSGSIDRAIHRQPEGMVIDPEGKLYIANEARDGLAKIHVFYPR